MTTYSITIPDTMRLGAIHRFLNPPRWSVSVSPCDEEYGAYFVTGFGLHAELELAAAAAVEDLNRNLENLRKIHVPAPKINLDIELDL